MTSSTIEGDMRIGRDPSCTDCPFGDGVAVLDLRSNTYFTLNEVGAFVWHCLEQPVTLAEIVTRVCQSFDVAEDVARRDVALLMDQMHDHGLLVLHGCADAGGSVRLEAAG